mgnify:CR=1 FL=1
MDFTHSLEVYAKYKRRNSKMKKFIVALLVISILFLGGCGQNLPDEQISLGKVEQLNIL